MSRTAITMNYLIKFAQVHEDFRLAEIEAIATSLGIHLSVINYSPEVRSLTYVVRNEILTKDQSHPYA